MKDRNVKNKKPKSTSGRITGRVSMPANKTSLGFMAQSEGTVTSTGKMNGLSVKRVILSCTCQGMNSNCFKCSGTGYREANLLSSHVPLNQVNQRGTQQTASVKIESQFSNDPRGGDSYGIRENGRFNSNPLHDDHS